MSLPKAVYGRDGRLLGITYDNGEVLKRINTNPEDGPLQMDWNEFLRDIARILITRIPRDTESPQAMAMIAEDDERLKGFYSG